MSGIDKKEFTFVADVEKTNETLRPSLTYWRDAWRRLKKNKLAMVGLVGYNSDRAFWCHRPVFHQFFVFGPNQRI